MIARAPWREAVTYRDTWPHEYVVVEKDGQQELLAAFHHRVSQGEGVECRFFHRTQKYLFLGEYKYWALQDGDETILNRALLYKDRRDFVIREGDTGVGEVEAQGGEEMAEEVDVRERWPNEAQDFTPWLAQNLGLLSDKLGMQLELVSQEEPVGPFYLDILAKNVSDGTLVAIENQLEWSNHVHLGQLLTYAAVLDVRTVIWVAYGFTNEHGQVINWLNEWTSDAVRFYGVEVWVTKTRDSSLTPHFNVAASPSIEWKYQDDQSGLLPRTAKLRAFFQSLRRELWRTEFSDGTPVGRSYYENGIQGLASTLSADISYQTSLERNTDAWVSLYVGTADDERTNRIFGALQNGQEEIEANFDVANSPELQWMGDDGTGRSGVHVWTECSIEDPPEKLAETRAWMIENLIKFKAMFEPRLKEILREIPDDDRGERIW